MEYKESVFVLAAKDEEKRVRRKKVKEKKKSKENGFDFVMFV